MTTHVTSTLDRQADHYKISCGNHTATIPFAAVANKDYSPARRTTQLDRTCWAFEFATRTKPNADWPSVCEAAAKNLHISVAEIHIH